MHIVLPIVCTRVFPISEWVLHIGTMYDWIIIINYITTLLSFQVVSVERIFFPLAMNNKLNFIMTNIWTFYTSKQTLNWVQIKYEKKRKISIRLPAMGKEQPRFYCSCSSTVMKNAIPLKALAHERILL